MNKQDVVKNFTFGFVIGTAAYSTFLLIEKLKAYKKSKQKLEPYKYAYQFIMKKAMDGAYANDPNLEQMKIDYDYALMVANLDK